MVNQVEEVITRLLGETAPQYLARTNVEFMEQTGKRANFGDAGRDLIDAYWREAGVTKEYGERMGLTINGAAVRPIGPGWRIRWRHL